MEKKLIGGGYRGQKAESKEKLCPNSLIIPIRKARANKRSIGLHWGKKRTGK